MKKILISALITFLLTMIGSLYFFRKELDIMAQIYVALILKGVRTYSSVPKSIKPKVRQILIDIEMEELIDE